MEVAGERVESYSQTDSDQTAGRLVPLAKTVQKWTLAGLIGMTAALFVVPAAADDGEVCVRGSGDTAIEACTRLLKSGRYDKRNLALIYSNRANQWERKGDLDKAMQDHGEAIRTDATYAAGYMHRGNAYAGDGDEGGYHDPCGDFGPGGRSDLVSLEHAACRGA